MTVEEYIKLEWKKRVDELSVEALYEVITSGLLECKDGGICKMCELFFESCPDTLKDDEICKLRFRIICQKEVLEW